MATNNMSALLKALPTKAGSIDYANVTDAHLGKAEAKGLLDPALRKLLEAKRAEALAKSAPKGRLVPEKTESAPAEATLTDAQVCALVGEGMTEAVFASLPEVARNALRQSAKNVAKSMERRAMKFDVGEAGWAKIAYGGRFPVNVPAEVLVRMLIDERESLLDAVTEHFGRCSFVDASRRDATAAKLKLAGRTVSAEALAKAPLKKD